MVGFRFSVIFKKEELQAIDRNDPVTPFIGNDDLNRTCRGKGNVAHRPWFAFDENRLALVHPEFEPTRRNENAHFHAAGAIFVI